MSIRTQISPQTLAWQDVTPTASIAFAWQDVTPTASIAFAWQDVTPTDSIAFAWCRTSLLQLVLHSLGAGRHSYS